jgi:hypothetical protein
VTEGGKAMPARITIDTKRALEEKELAARNREMDQSVIRADTVRVVDDGVVENGANMEARRNAEIDAKTGAFTGILIVDGVIMPKSAFANLPKMNLASVEILKGEEAKKLYGERAAAGVIKVTTKK